MPLGFCNPTIGFFLQVCYKETTGTGTTAASLTGDKHYVSTKPQAPKGSLMCWKWRACSAVAHSAHIHAGTSSWKSFPARQTCVLQQQFTLFSAAQALRPHTYRRLEANAVCAPATSASFIASRKNHTSYPRRPKKGRTRRERTNRGFSGRESKGEYLRRAG